MTLQQFLDFHIRYVREAVKGVAPGGDLRPMLMFDGPEGRGIVPLNLDNKDAEMAAARAFLREKQARQYAMIAAAWTVDLTCEDRAEADRLRELAHEHGTGHPELKPYRRECYMISAGDRRHTLYTHLLVARDEAGRITGLDQRTFPGVFAGRMTGLLEEGTVH